MSISDNMYKWKSLEKTVYKETDINLCYQVSLEKISFEFILPFIENDFLINDFCRYYDGFTIAKKSKDLIDYLVREYKLKVPKESLYGLAAAIQSHFIYIYDNPIKIDEDLHEVEMDLLEYKMLFDLIERFIKGESLATFNSVTIEYNKKFAFKSTFVYKTILYSLVDHYGITEDNFYKVKTDVLSEKSSLKLDKLSEFHKYNYIIALHKFLTVDTPGIKIINKNVRFIVCYLLSAQIPISKFSGEILLPESIKDVSQTDLVNLRKYLKGEKKLFLNI